MVATVRVGGEVGGEQQQLARGGKRGGALGRKGCRVARGGGGGEVIGVAQRFVAGAPKQGGPAGAGAEPVSQHGAGLGIGEDRFAVSPGFAQLGELVLERGEVCASEAGDGEPGEEPRFGGGAGDLAGGDGGHGAGLPLGESAGGSAGNEEGGRVHGHGI